MYVPGSPVQIKLVQILKLWIFVQNYAYNIQDCLSNPKMSFVLAYDN